MILEKNEKPICPYCKQPMFIDYEMDITYKTTFHWKCNCSQKMLSHMYMENEG